MKTLEGGPPSSDLTYVLPEAESAISFALPLNKEYIRSFLAKKNWIDHTRDNIEVNRRSVILSNEVIEILQKKGFKAAQPPEPGNYISFRQKKGANEGDMEGDPQYRLEVPNWRMILPPHLSHKYIAVRSGVGSYGWSGCVGIKDIGANIILGTVVTNAKLKPTNPLPPEESFCDNCNICVASCVSGFLVRNEETSVVLGGEEFTHCARRSKLRCQLVCGGFSGLHSSGKWSTWSPGRFKIPEDDRKMVRTLVSAVTKYNKWPDSTQPEYISPFRGLRLTCAFCQLVCFGNKKETLENYKILKNSGCVVQDTNGDYLILPPDEAKGYFEKLPHEHKRLYQ
ncbi:MAG: epoxyqueuosine reductase [Promethearchaeota archaeon]|nr:MAG: epoxyqueuosine reductase [Candidatus Lokiarchaeota archaeon]